MTHLRNEDRTNKHRMSACRRGQHDYGAEQNIGAGIVRAVCRTCAAVSIHLIHADRLASLASSPTGNFGALTNRDY